jgi:glycosyltransferase involved in cell wall biosynthesis
MITVIIPTLGKIKRLSTTLAELSECKYVGEIILIDNTINQTKINLNKLVHVLEGHNTFVSAAWNKGVEMSKYDKLLILNDDTWFDWESIGEIEKHITSLSGMIGISRHNYSLKADSPIKIEAIPTRPEAFACAFFIHKKSWTQIPKEIRLWYNDDWLFLNNIRKGKSNYILRNLAVEGEIGGTISSVTLGCEAHLSSAKLGTEEIRKIVQQDCDYFFALMGEPPRV